MQRLRPFRLVAVELIQHATRHRTGRDVGTPAALESPRGREIPVPAQPLRNVDVEVMPPVTSGIKLHAAVELHALTVKGPERLRPSVADLSASLACCLLCQKLHTVCPAPALRHQVVPIPDRSVRGTFPVVHHIVQPLVVALYGKQDTVAEVLGQAGRHLV